VRLPNFAAGDIRKGSRILLQKMEEVRVLLGVRRLSVIGQGLGGLVARCTVEEMEGRDYLGRLVMLGTPNEGSYSFAPCFVFKAARQMFPGSPFLTALNEAYDDILDGETVPPYASIYSPFDMTTIPTRNAGLGSSLNLKLGWFCTHFGLVRSKRVLGIIADVLEGESVKDTSDAEDELLRELSESLEEDPHNENNLLRRGRLLLDSGYYELAIRDLTRLLRLRPDFADAYMLRGEALRRKMSYDENPIYNRAIRDFNQVIRLRPGWAEAYYERGVCYALLNGWTEAVENWDRALIINRDLYQAYMVRGLGRRKKGDISGAIKDFTEVLRIQPDEPEALHFLSELGA
jgi:tetratricopeptide (TPR) repeat protein